MEKLQNKLWIFGHPTNFLKGVLGVQADLCLGGTI